MSTLVVALRIASLLVFAGPMLLAGARHGGRSGSRAPRSGSELAPLAAHLAAVGMYVPSLLVFSGSATGSIALLLAWSGLLLAVAGVALVVRSRAELGPAWSFAPRADRGTGLVTTGPYRLVRHPIYLGLALLTTGQALAFASWPALVIVLFGIVPTFAWRARTEEAMLGRAFGDRYAEYRQRSRMIIPYLL